MDILSGELPRFRANLHGHSTLSDGCMTPEQMKAAYRAQGYSIIAITDHEMMFDYRELNEEGRFLVIPGYELGFGDVVRGTGPCDPVIHLTLLSRSAEPAGHVNFRPEWCWASTRAQKNAAKSVGPVFGREVTPETINATIAEARKRGFLVFLNHPCWSLITYDTIKDIKGLSAIEIWNTASIVNSGSCDPSVFYDEMLRLDPSIGCVATDDCHSDLPLSHPRRDWGRGWVEIVAPELTREAVFSALESRSFYSSTGPAIERISLDGRDLFLKTSTPVRAAYVRSASRKVCSHLPEREGETFTEAHFKVKNGMFGYLRVIVEDESGRRAWSNAFASPVKDPRA